jgi:hypothetical protein
MFSEQEEKNIKEFPDCDQEPKETKDLIFLYPKEFDGNPQKIIKELQDMYELLRQLTDLNPVEKNELRIPIGFYKCKNPCISRSPDNRIYIPWKRLSKHDEPQQACTHELVHPFARISKLFTEENKVWEEPFCDFLRGVLKNHIGQDGIGCWEKQVESAEKRKNNRAYTGAGLFILDAKRIFCNDNLNNDEFIREFIYDFDKLKEYIKLLLNEYSSMPIHKRNGFFLTDKMEKKLKK